MKSKFHCSETIFCDVHIRNDRKILIYSARKEVYLVIFSFSYKDVECFNTNFNVVEIINSYFLNKFFEIIFR